MVTYSYFMSVSAQVFYYLIRSGKWLLGVNNPRCFVQGINKLLLLWQLLLQGTYKLPPKDYGKALDTEQKHFVIFRDTYLFPLTPVIDPSSGNNTMDMRVQAKVLSPCMQYRHHARFCMQLCVRELRNSLPGAGKEQVVKICR